MNSVVNYAAKKVVGNVTERIHTNPPSYEPHPEVIAAAEEVASKTKQHWYNKKVIATPDLILSKEERKILSKVKSRAWYLDKGCHCCCCDIGLDGFIGIIPGIGDFITTLLALQLVKTAARANLPKHIITQMLWNVFIDFIIGLTPIAGDILDILFKCNLKNAVILEEYLITRRMDEIRLERGVDVTLLPNAAQNRAESSRLPPPIPNSKPQGGAHGLLQEQLHDAAQNNKYGTFFNWSG